MPGTKVFEDIKIMRIGSSIGFILPYQVAKHYKIEVGDVFASLELHGQTRDGEVVE